MRLVYQSVNMELEFTDSNPWVLVIENNTLFSEMVENMWIQSEGGDGLFILSEKDKALKIDKKLCFITNPFAVSCNDKKIINKIYSELTDLTNEYCYERKTEVNSEIVSFIDYVSNMLPYPVEYSMDLNLNGLFKLYDVRIDDECSGIDDKLISYIKLMHKVCGTEIFVFLNLKQYLDIEKMAELYKECLYEDVRIIDIEGYDVGKRIEFEKYVIIDKDLCVVHI